MLKTSIDLLARDSRQSRLERLAAKEVAKPELEFLASDKAFRKLLGIRTQNEKAKSLSTQSKKVDRRRNANI